MDNIAIETLSINAVRDSIVTSEYLNQFITDNDKEPTWDGFVYIYRNKNKKKEDLIGRIAVQVKGKLSKKIDHKYINYPVSVVDLKNYLTDGIIIFVVYILNNFVDYSTPKNKIYYTDLSPLDIRRYLNQAKGKKSKSIKFHPFPQKSIDKSNIFLNAHLNFQKQKSFTNSKLLTIDELNKSGILDSITTSFSSFGEKNNFISHILNTDKYYLYAKIKNTDILQPLDIELRMESITHDLHIPISINGITYYEKISFIQAKHENYLKFSENFKFILKEDSSTVNFNYTISRNLRVRVIELEFLLSIIQYGYINLGKDKIIIDLTQNAMATFDIKKTQNDIIYLKKIIQLFDGFGIQDDIDLLKLSKQDWHHIDVLIKSIQNGQEVEGFNLETNKLVYINILNFKLLVFIEIKGKNKYRLYDFFNQKLDFVMVNKITNEKHPVSQYYALKIEQFLKSSNINYKNIVNDFKNIGANEFNLSCANLFLLEVLKAYDQMIGSNKNLLLELAKNLNNWFNSIDKRNFLPKEIKLLNNLQTVLRERALKHKEINDLYLLIKRKNITNGIKVGAYLLLGEKDKAKKQFNEMTKEEQDLFIEYPIYHFW